MKRRYVIVGLGYRGTHMFLNPMVQDYANVAEVVALCDVNHKRLELARDLAKLEVPIYTDYDKMLEEIDCDCVIVTTPDYLHHEIIIKSLYSGKDVISEKPLTIFDDKCQEIIKAEQESGKKVTVTFNCRFQPYNIAIKKFLLERKVGEIHSVELNWFLDTLHGADYYRRWHRKLENSGGLLLHKATHHLDLVNWFIDQEPKTVFGNGKLNYYGQDRKEHGERCLTCQHREKCNFYLDLESDQELKELYLLTEDVDGYYRDRCVFEKEINIYDTMSLLVEYDGGALLSYSLNSFLPFEGWRLVINGSKGRMECRSTLSFSATEQFKLAKRELSSKSVDPWLHESGINKIPEEGTIYFYPLFGGMETYKVKYWKGTHGGSDKLLRDKLFYGVDEDPLGQMADSWAGAMSLLIGVAGNKSIAQGRPVAIEDLLGGLKK